VGPSWPWSYGSLIYNYLCNQCLSPLTMGVVMPLRPCNIVKKHKTMFICFQRGNKFCIIIITHDRYYTDLYFFYLCILFTISLQWYTSRTICKLIIDGSNLTDPGLLIFFKCTSTSLFTGSTFYPNLNNFHEYLIQLCTWYRPLSQIIFFTNTNKNLFFYIFFLQLTIK